MNAPTFTVREWAILADRLGLADAVAEVLPGDEAEVLQRCNDLNDAGRVTPELDDALTLAVLRECAEGSTFLCNLFDAVEFGELSRGSALAYFRAARTLGDKLGVEVPTV